MATKSFHISDVLSITTGRLVSTRHVEGIYDILNWMTGDSIFTHQIPRAMKHCEPVLCEAFPQLTGDAIEAKCELMSDLDRRITEAGRDREKVEQVCAEWLSKMEGIYGTHFDVPTLAEWERRDPVEEAVEVFGKDKVMVVKPK